MVSLYICLNDETIAIVDYDHESAADRRRMDGWVLTPEGWVFDVGAKKATDWMLPQGWDYGTIRQLINTGQPGTIVEYQPTPAGPPQTAREPWWQQMQYTAQQQERQLDHEWLRGMLEGQTATQIQQLAEQQQQYEDLRRHILEHMQLQAQPHVRLPDGTTYDLMRQEGLDMGTQEVYERAFAQRETQAQQNEAAQREAQAHRRAYANWYNAWRGERGE